MYRDSLQCSGIFRVPGFIDGRNIHQTFLASKYDIKQHSDAT